MSQEYRVSATAELVSQWICTPDTTVQATEKDVAVTVKDGYMAGDEYGAIEIYKPQEDGDTVFTRVKFEDIHELEALAELIQSRVDEIRSDKELGLIE